MSQSESTIDADRFKAALRLLPEPVAIVTTVHDGHKHGMTATAFASVSAEPPQILVCVNEKATSWGLIRDSGKFAVNFLPTKMSDLAHHFSKTADNKDDKFDSALWKTLESGAPILNDAVSALDCVFGTADTQRHASDPGRAHCRYMARRERGYVALLRRCIWAIPQGITDL